MKNLKSLIYSLAALSLVTVGCQQKEVFTPGEPDVAGCQKVYFPTQDLSSYEYLSPEAECAFEVTIARELDDQAAVVPVVVTANEDGIFEVEEVRFEAGQKETTFLVTFDKAELGKLYTATFAVKDPKFASKYSSAPTYLQFKTMRVEWKYFTNPAGEKAKFTFDSSPFWEEIHTGYVKYYEVDGVRYCVTETDPQGGSFGFWGTGEFQGDGEVSFEWYPKVSTAAGNQAVLVNNCPVWYADNYGETVYRWDWFEWWTIKNPQAALAGMTFPQFVSKYEGNYPVSYYDGNGTFVFHAAYYNISAGNFASDLDDVFLVADGFTRIDYSFDMSSDYSYGGVLPVYFEAGADVASIKVAAAQGELGAKALEALVSDVAAGKAGENVSMEELAAGLTFEETDMYTVVAVAFNEAGEAVNSASLTAFYVTLEDQKDYAVEASVGFEAAPERYELDPCTTAAYWIAGHDLTEVHMTVAKASNVTAKLLASVKSDSKYALSDDELEQVNAVGGLYDYLTGLTPGTEYTLVVWATNGSLEKYWALSYTTEKLPYVWNYVGEGVWTDTIIGEFFNVPEEISVPADVYEEANTPGLYKVNNFALHLIAEVFETTEEEMEPYGGNWHEVDLLIDATNPAKVVMDVQDYGVCLSSQYGFFLIGNRYAGEVVEYGKLEDGKITFAKGKFFAGLPAVGLFDDCNESGKTGLTLPSSESLKSVSVANSQPKNYVELPEMPLKSIAKNAYKAEKIAIERDIHVVDAKIVKIAPKVKANRNSAPKAEKLNSIR